MISSFRNFAKTKFAGLLVFIMIIPFVFWGMGSMFSSGNTNNLAKVDNENITTQDFIDYLNNSGIPQETIRNNLKNNVIEELLSTLVSTTLMDLEIKDFDLIISEKTLLKKIKKNQNFLDDDGNFQRVKYEKFLLENNQSAAGFELRLKKRELQKHLFEYVGAGSITPKFLIEKAFKEQNKKVEIEYLNLENFYKKKNEISKNDLSKFIQKNKDQLQIEYLDFSYSIINPKNLIGDDEFNQTFFDKIDQIEMDISNEVEFNNIVSNFNLKKIDINNFRFSNEKNDIEKKIFELRNTKFDIFENGNDYILYKVENINKREPDLNDNQIKDEITELVYQQNKFNFNKELLDKISEKQFNKEDFFKMGQNFIETINLNSIKDNNKFEINSVEVLYSLPVDSLTLINDEKNNIYLARIKKFNSIKIDSNDELKEYSKKENMNNRSILLESYDLFLNNKYDVVINQKTIDRVKNFFQ
jgi:peptidyl-prolyl cis-trans isomerase D